MSALLNLLSALHIDRERDTPVSYRKIRKIRRASNCNTECFHCGNAANGVGRADHSSTLQVFGKKYCLAVDTSKMHTAGGHRAGELNNNMENSYLSEPEYTPDLNFLFKLCQPVPNLV